MKNKLLPLIILILIVSIGVFFFLRKPQMTQTQPEQKLPIPTGHYDLGDNSSMYHEADPIEIQVSEGGFEPQEITIKVGDVVVFRNADNTEHDIESLPHPQHTAHTELNLGVIEGIDSKSLLLTQPGVYEYHDHLNPENRGKITVE